MNTRPEILVIVCPCCRSPNVEPLPKFNGTQCQRCNCTWAEGKRVYALAPEVETAFFQHAMKVIPVGTDFIVGARRLWDLARSPEYASAL